MKKEILGIVYAMLFSLVYMILNILPNPDIFTNFVLVNYEHLLMLLYHILMLWEKNNQAA